MMGARADRASEGKRTKKLLDFDSCHVPSQSVVVSRKEGSLEKKSKLNLRSTHKTRPIFYLFSFYPYAQSSISSEEEKTCAQN